MRLSQNLFTFLVGIPLFFGQSLLFYYVYQAIVILSTSLQNETLNRI